MNRVKCPVCDGPAIQEPEQDDTIYCQNERCGFMGLLPTGLE